MSDIEKRSAAVSLRPEKGDSLLSQHLQILGMDRQGASESPALMAERARIARMALPPLKISTRKPRTQLYPALGLAASLLLLLLGGILAKNQANQPSSEGLRSKGDSKVWLYWERAGKVSPWEPGVPLLNGDRVRVEILAAEDLVAYQAVLNEKGVLLSDPMLVLDNPMSLKAGAKESFEGSIKLVGAEEGETLLVMICKEPVVAEIRDQLRAVFKEQRMQVNLSLIPDICKIERHKLR